jgi:hypothetical protein
VALVEALVPAERIAADRRGELVRATAAFVARQLEALPGSLRLLFAIGMFGFRLLSWRRLRSFESLPLERRRAVAAWWAWGPLPPARQLFKPVRATALLAFHEYAPVRAAPRLAVLPKAVAR